MKKTLIGTGFCGTGFDCHRGRSRIGRMRVILMVARFLYCIATFQALSVLLIENVSFSFSTEEREEGSPPAFPHYALLVFLVLSFQEIRFLSYMPPFFHALFCI